MLCRDVAQKLDAVLATEVARPRDEHGTCFDHLIGPDVSPELVDDRVRDNGAFAVPPGAGIAIVNNSRKDAEVKVAEIAPR